MYEPRPSDITLPPTISIDLSHLVAVAVAAATSTSMTDHANESERAA